MSAENIRAGNSRESTPVFDLCRLAESCSPCSVSNWMRLAAPKRRRILQDHARTPRPSPLRDTDLHRTFPKSAAKVDCGQGRGPEKNSTEFRQRVFPSR